MVSLWIHINIKIHRLISIHVSWTRMDPERYVFEKAEARYMRDTCGIHVSAEVTMRGNQDTCWIHARYIITCYIHAGYVYMYRSENVSMASSCAARAWKRVVCVTSEACCVNVHTSFSWRPTALAPQLFRDWLFAPPVSRFTVNKKAQICC